MRETYKISLCHLLLFVWPILEFGFLPPRRRGGNGPLRLRTAVKFPHAAMVEGPDIMFADKDLIRDIDGVAKEVAAGVGHGRCLRLFAKKTIPATIALTKRTKMEMFLSEGTFS